MNPTDRNFSYMKHLLILILIFSIPILTSCGINPTNLKEASESKISSPTDVFTLKKQRLEKDLHIPGELLPYESVDIFPKVEGFIKDIYVDKGSVVKKGQVLISLVAPELEEQTSEAQAKLQSDENTYNRLKAASETPGVISENELVTSQKQAEASSAHLKSLQSTKSYLQITSPFDGVITERNVHTGALVGPSGAGASKPLLHIEKVSTLRVVVPVPEYAVSGIKKGTSVNFTVAAFPEKILTAKVSRIPNSIDPKTRTEQIELDFNNSNELLSPGMYPEIIWKINRPEPTFFVPTSSVVTTTERTFVIRAEDDNAEWVDVMVGYSIKDLVEIFGDLNEGDKIVFRATDEIINGTKIKTKVINLN